MLDWISSLGFQYERIRLTATPAYPVRRVVVLVRGANPSFDYYLAPRLKGLSHEVVDITKEPSDLQLREGDFVLVCRYMSARWNKRLRVAKGLAGFGFFFDDDYAAFVTDPAIPLAYRLDVAYHGLYPLVRAAPKLTHLFVSTPLLRERFSAADPIVLQPAPSACDFAPVRSSPDAGRLRIAYHAQTSHLADHALCAEICRIVNRAYPDITFDIVGPPAAKRYWHGLSAAVFRNESDWVRYRSESRTMGADILIAPLLDTPLNRARAATKAIDAVRLGAVGLFPDLPPYQSLRGIIPLIDGGLEEWASRIIALASDKVQREHQATTLRAAVEGWANPGTLPLVTS